MILRTWWKDRSGQLQSAAETRICQRRASKPHLTSTSLQTHPGPDDKHAPSLCVSSRGFNWWNQDGETSNTLHSCSFLIPSSLTCLFPCVGLLCRSLSLSLFFQRPRMKSPQNQKLPGYMHTGHDSVTHKFIPGCPGGGLPFFWGAGLSWGPRANFSCDEHWTI